MLSRETSFLRYCRHFGSPRPFFDVFRPSASRKTRILLCFGGENRPKGAFWCPKDTYFTSFSSLCIAFAGLAKTIVFYGVWGLKKLRFCSFHRQMLTNVSARIAPLAGLRRLLPPGLLLCQFRSQKTVVFHRFASPTTRVLWCFGGFRPSKRCLLVSPRHVFYVLFEPLLGFRENA